MYCRTADENDGPAGVLRGKVIRTTISHKTAAAADQVHRQFVARTSKSALVCRILHVSARKGFCVMWSSSSMCSLAWSLVGGAHHRWRRRSSWMHWNRRYESSPTGTIHPMIKTRGTSHWHTWSYPRNMDTGLKRGSCFQIVPDWGRHTNCAAATDCNHIRYN